MSENDNEITAGEKRSLSEQAQAWTNEANNQGNPQALFGPGVPIAPIWPEERPRVFQYTPGINLSSIPRSGYGLAPFQMLRNLSMASKEIRLNIELIKREVRALKWEIVPSKKDDPAAGTYTPEIDELRGELDNLDGQHDFDQWVSMALEEVLTTDALTLWPDKDPVTNHTEVDVIDGATIRPLLDMRGRVAKPPLPGYIQQIYGMPMSWYTSDRLLYKPMNASVASPYGTSPIEYILLAVNLGLRRDTYHVGFYTEGNVPEALVGAPSSWKQSDIESWQSYWDAMVAGNMKRLRRMHWVPLEGSRGSVPVYEFRKDNTDSVALDTWLMQVACWAFGNSPSEFGLTPGQGLGGAGFSDSMENVQYRSMLGPITQFLERLFNHLLQQVLGKRHLKFIWVGMDPQEDKLVQAQVDEIYLRTGVYDLGYVQNREGIPPANRPAEPPLSASSLLYGLVPTASPVNLPAGLGFAAGGRTPQGDFFRGWDDPESIKTSNSLDGGKGVPAGVDGVLDGSAQANRSGGEA